MTDQNSDHDSPQPAASDAADRPMMRLDDALKRAGLVGTGGQAKIWIQDGQVTVNGQVETRRRKQLFLGDVVETMGQRVTLDETFFDC
ncbi:ribosome-associated protein [Stieleria maiorica]|uniref:Ribosome-associated protein n=1 Tax=Stieleria maiorica TaxID=2795974 RepID=A0A5B9MLJ0_9BACT|nr:RNA-binding S4 domain-containing protein [Stieleria maiorica]QEG01854.1 ribosome-associated protein [Stieleria maiorica]